MVEMSENRVKVERQMSCTTRFSATFDRIKSKLAEAEREAVDNGWEDLKVSIEAEMYEDYDVDPYPVFTVKITGTRRENPDEQEQRRREHIERVNEERVQKFGRDVEWALRCISVLDVKEEDFAVNLYCEQCSAINHTRPLDHDGKPVRVTALCPIHSYTDHIPVLLFKGSEIKG
jgi:hypothetical protein